MPAHSVQVPIADLVQCFFDEAEGAFGPWLRERDGRLTRDLTHANRAGKLERTTPGQIHGFFSAVVDFETPRILGSLTFGDRELGVDAVATPRGRPERHGLWEWAHAIARPDLVPHNTDFVLQLDRMSDIVRRFADAMRELEGVIAEAAPDTLARLAADRTLRQAAQEAEWREAEHRGTVRIANDAFKRCDWRRAAELLESVEDRLSRAELAKLAYARRRAGS
jgi:hypothetical protein